MNIKYNHVMTVFPELAWKPHGVDKHTRVVVCACACEWACGFCIHRIMILDYS